MTGTLPHVDGSAGIAIRLRIALTKRAILREKDSSGVRLTREERIEFNRLHSYCAKMTSRLEAARAAEAGGAP